jgi:hypothetical protein
LTSPGLSAPSPPAAVEGPPELTALSDRFWLFFFSPSTGRLPWATADSPGLLASSASAFGALAAAVEEGGRMLSLGPTAALLNEAELPAAGGQAIWPVDSGGIVDEVGDGGCCGSM